MLWPFSSDLDEFSVLLQAVIPGVSLLSLCLQGECEVLQYQAAESHTGTFHAPLFCHRWVPRRVLAACCLLPRMAKNIRGRVSWCTRVRTFLCGFTLERKCWLRAVADGSLVSKVVVPVDPPPRGAHVRPPGWAEASPTLLTSGSWVVPVGG